MSERDSTQSRPSTYSGQLQMYQDTSNSSTPKTHSVSEPASARHSAVSQSNSSVMVRAHKRTLSDTSSHGTEVLSDEDMGEDSLMDLSVSTMPVLRASRASSSKTIVSAMQSRSSSKAAVTRPSVTFSESPQLLKDETRDYIDDVNKQMAAGLLKKEDMEDPEVLNQPPASIPLEAVVVMPSSGSQHHVAFDEDPDDVVASLSHRSKASSANSTFRYSLHNPRLAGLGHVRRRETLIVDDEDANQIHQHFAQSQLSLSSATADRTGNMRSITTETGQVLISPLHPPAAPAQPQSPQPSSSGTSSDHPRNPRARPSDSKSRFSIFSRSRDQHVAVVVRGAEQPLPVAAAKAARAPSLDDKNRFVLGAVHLRLEYDRDKIRSATAADGFDPSVEQVEDHRLVISLMELESRLSLSQAETSICEFRMQLGAHKFLVVNPHLPEDDAEYAALRTEAATTTRVDLAKHSVASGSVLAPSGETVYINPKWEDEVTFMWSEPVNMSNSILWCTVRHGPTHNVVFGEVAIAVSSIPVDTAVQEWFELKRPGTSAAVLFSKISRKFGMHDLWSSHRVSTQGGLLKKRWYTKKFSLRTIIVALLITQIILVVAVSLGITYSTTIDQVKQLGKNVIAQLADAITENLEQIFSVPYATVSNTVAYYQLINNPFNVMNTTQAQRWAYYSTFAGLTLESLVTTHQLFITLIYVGFANGFFYGNGLYQSADDYALGTYVLNPAFLGTTNRTVFNVSLTCGNFEDCLPFDLTEVLFTAPYNTTQRPWYVLGASVSYPIWTKSYLFASSNQLGITATQRFCDPVSPPSTDCTLRGVAAIDVTLADISDYLTTLNYPDGGYSFLVEGSTGYLIASSIDAPLSTGNPPVQVIATQSSDPRISAIAQSTTCVVCPCPRPDINNWNCATFQPSLTESDGQFINVQNFSTGGRGLNLIVFIVVPTSTFTQSINDALFTAVGVAIGLIFIAVILTFILASKITQRLTSTTKKLKQFSELDFSKGINMSGLISPIKEVCRVSYALLSMRTSLRSFSKYVPHEVVRFLSQKRMEATLGGDKRVITILFSDIADFTKISETLPLDGLIELMGEYLEEMSDIILAEHGLIDKYIGDAVMALFNVPSALEKHAYACCSAALKCHKRLAELRVVWLRKGYPEVHARIGIHTGEALVGNFGSKGRLNYTAIGDSVNLASRLEGLNKSYGTYIMISEVTQKMVALHFVTRPLDMVAVKGKVKPVCVYELIDDYASASKEEVEDAELFTHAWDTYLARDFASAITLFERYQARHPDDIACHTHLETSRLYAVNPPPADWAGIKVMRTK